MSDFEKTILFYKESSDNDYAVAQKLFDQNEFGYALFFCHLSLEKLLKAITVEHINMPAEYTHSLIRLSELSNLKPTI